MADTIEFKNLALPLDRFAPELLEQLRELAPSAIAVDGEQLIVRHCYVERRLTTGETTRYEAHLAACSPCRKTVVALTRLARAEAEPARPDVAVVGRAAGASPARRWLGALTAPQWAMAAAAAIVIAVALPLVLSSRAGRNDQAPSVNESSASQPAASTLAGGPEQKSSTDNAAGTPARAAGRENATDRAASPSEKPASTFEQAKKEAPAEALGASGDPNGGAPAGATPAEPKAADQVLAKSDSPAPPAGATAAAPPPAPQSEEKESRQAVDNKEAAKPAATQPGRGEGAERAKADSDAQTVAIAPPPVRLRKGDPPKTKRSNRVAGPAFSAFSGSSGEAARAPERKVGDHLFSLRGETWTDNDYDAGKDLPVVTIIRDSEVYRDLLAKEEKIKPFLTGFPADARVLFVFKGTVYSLIPQKGDK